MIRVDKERLEIVGGYVQHIVKVKSEPFKVVLSTQQCEAIGNAAVVTCQLRLGMMPAWRGNEYLGQRRGLIKHKTIGVG